MGKEKSKFICKDCGLEFDNGRSYSNHTRFGCGAKKKESWKRKCPRFENNPNCITEIQYQSKYHYDLAIKENKMCRSCTAKATIEQGNAKKRETGNWGWDTRRKNGTDKHTEESKEKISNTLKEGYENGTHVVWNEGLTAQTDDRVAKTGKSRPGELNPMYGTSYLEKWKEWYGEEEAERKNRKTTKGKVGSFKNLFHNVNPEACKIIKEYGKKYGYNFHTGEDGPEYVCKSGYFADGYDKERNVWIEYDEPHHFVGKTLRDRDIKRQEIIIKELNCKLIRIRYDGQITII